MSFEIPSKPNLAGFDKSFALLQDAFHSGSNRLNNLEKEGVVHRFKICFKLAFSSLQSFLEDEGFGPLPGAHKDIIAQGVYAKILSNEKVWIEMLLLYRRILRANEPAFFEKAAWAIESKFISPLSALSESLRFGVIA